MHSEVQQNGPGSQPAEGEHGLLVMFVFKIY